MAPEWTPSAPRRSVEHQPEAPSVKLARCRCPDPHMIASECPAYGPTRDVDDHNFLGDSNQLVCLESKCGMPRDRHLHFPDEVWSLQEAEATGGDRLRTMRLRFDVRDGAKYVRSEVIPSIAIRDYTLTERAHEVPQLTVTLLPRRFTRR